MDETNMQHFDVKIKSNLLANIAVNKVPSTYINSIVENPYLLAVLYVKIKILRDKMDCPFN